MHQLKNIQNISGLFFYLLGLIIFGLILMIHNGFYAELPVIILKSLDLPFMFVALLYGLSGFRLSLGDELKSDTIDAVLIFGGVFAFMAMLYLNFAFQDFI